MIASPGVIINGRDDGQIALKNDQSTLDLQNEFLFPAWLRSLGCCRGRFDMLQLESDVNVGVRRLLGSSAYVGFSYCRKRGDSLNAYNKQIVSNAKNISYIHQKR